MRHLYRARQYRISKNSTLDLRYNEASLLFLMALHYYGVPYNLLSTHHIVEGSRISRASWFSRDTSRSLGRFSK